jgi:hypothetical protein
LSPVELAATVAVLGSVLAVFVPTFVRNVHASRFAEPQDGLKRIAMRATALAAGESPESAYPESVGLTPAQVPQGKPTTDPAGTWEQNTWRKLDFRLEGPHYYSFSFESSRAAGVSRFTAVAHGDLDGDGILSTFSISGESKLGAEPTTGPIFMQREIE